jgi:hypothetical protein
LAIHELAARSAPACLLDLQGTVLFLNEAWERAVRDCTGGLVGEASVGVHLAHSVLGDEGRRILRSLLDRAARQRPGGPPIAVTSECNCPAVARLVSTRVAPVCSGEELIGLSLQHQLVRERPPAEVYLVVDGSGRSYRAADGVLEQCSCCRRTRRPGEPGEWDFVPGLVAAPPADTRFGYCPLCRGLHHPDGAVGEGGEG